MMMIENGLRFSHICATSKSRVEIEDQDDKYTLNGKLQVDLRNNEVKLISRSSQDKDEI